MDLSERTVPENKMSLIMLVALMGHHTLTSNGQTGKQTHYTGCFMTLGHNCRR